MASLLILATVLALSGVVSVAIAWAVLGSLLYVMRQRAGAAAAAAPARVERQ